jgi:hypothetical protein
MAAKRIADMKRVVAEQRLAERASLPRSCGRWDLPAEACTGKGSAEFVGSDENDPPECVGVSLTAVKTLGPDLPRSNAYYCREVSKKKRGINLQAQLLDRLAPNGAR